MKVVEILTQAAGRYCQSSFSLAFAHIWCTIISYIALPVGIVAVIQFYVRVKNEPQVKPNRPTQKIWAFKGVLLLNFVQEVRSINCAFGLLLIVTDRLHHPRGHTYLQGNGNRHIT